MANQIVIAGGQVGSTNWINTEVADNEYPVMGSGIKAAIDAAGGGGFNPFILNTVYGEGDDPEIGVDKTDEEIYEAIQAGTKYFALFGADTGTLVAISSPDVDGYNNIGIFWNGCFYVQDNEDGTGEIGYFSGEWHRGAGGSYSSLYTWVSVPIVTSLSP